jgi:large conductance mechanosensitive channel
MGEGKQCGKICKHLHPAWSSKTHLSFAGCARFSGQIGVRLALAWKPSPATLRATNPVLLMRDLTIEGAKKQLAIFKEFKEFAMRGNVVDLAVGVVIGAAFGKIVSSLVADIIMPPISWLTRGVNFANLFINLDPHKPVKTLEEARKLELPVITYGQFLTNVLDFIIVAFCIFLMVKAINKLQKPPAPAPAPAEPTREETLLAEMRDLLKSRS